MVSSEDMRLLAMLIEDEIKKEFSLTYLSGNLRESIRIEKGEGNGYNVIIPAALYDISEWKKTGVKNHKPGSYAAEVDKTGGFSGKHKDYVQRCVDKALVRWEALKREKYKKVRRM